MNIIEAMSDKALFAPHFKGTSWGPWKAFLACLFGLPLSADQMDLYRSHTGRETLPTQAFNEACLVIGRRGGKSRILALIATYLACFRTYTEHLAPGEVATIAVIAADRRQARVCMRFIIGMLDSNPMLRALRTDETAETVTLSNRVTIEVHTASFRVTRGYSFAAVLCDETAFWRSDDSANPDVEIFRALRPGLANIPGAMLLNASSPYRKGGVLYNTYQRHHGKDNARVLVWQASTLAMNPSLDPSIIADAYVDDPQSARAEYDAQFRDDLADFVSPEIVDAVTVTDRMELPPGAKYMAFVDPSGGSSDSMTLAIAHLRGGEIAVLDAVREVRPLFSPESVVEDFSALLNSYGVKEVHGDRYAGEWPRERFREHGIKYEISERVKSDIYRDCLPLLNSWKIELLDLPRLRSQLCSLERRTARGGRDSIDHPPGLHDDIANAALGAVLLTKQRPTATTVFHGSIEEFLAAGMAATAARNGALSGFGYSEWSASRRARGED